MTVVETLGLIAGAVWICAALYFELAREEDFTEYVLLFLGIGTGLWLLTSATWTGPRVATLLATAANLVFALLGFGAWYWLEHVRPDTAVDDVDQDLV
ncbi:hypothetical protein Hbl1158_10105 [Halobaculum sp. CBA1158]|uniref:hypothetical protein n=1 Tax=Halobaculum sp. CBA1158 TaxID=2904243 RepID=UPI001F3514B5|nr:hypothetical protein [Halobaculum sp. CBA1158]UIO98886.1 hypothetical protein Hbl1158_10105 [Halobaculum sp. CBA1158]